MNRNLKNLPNLSLAALLLATTFVLPGAAFAQDEQYMRYQQPAQLEYVRDQLAREKVVGETTGLGAGLTCAAAVSWSGVFTFGIAPALAGIICGSIASSAVRTTMRCSTDKDTRRKLGGKDGCVVLVLGLETKF